MGSARGFSGLRRAALAHPQASAAGQDAYATLEEKAAALLQSLAPGSRALMDGNRRLALTGVIALCMNGRGLIFTNDDTYDLVMAAAIGALDDVG